MNVNIFFHLIMFLAPVVSSLICCILTVLCYRDKDKHTCTELLKLLVLYYTTVAINWIGTLSYFFNYTAFLYISPLFYLSILLTMVVFYQFVFTLTKTDKNEKFSYFHYLLPFILFLTLGIWSFFVPYDVQYSLIESNGKHTDAYKWYSVFFTSKLPVRMIYTLLYTSFCFYRLLRYRKAVINYSADEERSTMQWLYLFFFLSFTMVPLSIIPLFISKQNLYSTFITAIPIALLILQHVILSYNMIMNNYVIIYPATGEEYGVSSKIDKKHFEKYIQTKKPYLNPKLKISDITTELQTNRNYLSSFINNTYNMNFNRYINICRLKELDQMQQDEDYTDYSEIELVSAAGFSNYRGYLRIKKKEKTSRPFRK